MSIGTIILWLLKLVGLFKGGSSSRIKLDVRSEKSIEAKRKRLDKLHARMMELVILLLSLGLMASGISCHSSSVPPNPSMTTLRDVAIKKGQVSPIDGVVVSWDRYEHLLLYERNRDD